MTEIKEWVSVLAPSASALAALTALGISLWVADAQRRIQRAQLRQNLFDKRYQVFLVVEEFLMYVQRMDGSVNLVGDEFRRFRSAEEQAEFLFDSDVVKYINGIRQTVNGLREKCIKRDHLVKMGQDAVPLSAGITQTLNDLEDPVRKDRKKVFRPYLQLSTSTTLERGAAPMKLNGWQRLWILVTAVWLLSVLVFSYSVWPTTTDITRAAVYARLKPSDASQLIDYHEAVPIPPGAVVDQPPIDLSAGLVPKDTLSAWTPVPGLIVDIDGHTLQFVKGVSAKDMNHTADAYRAALRHILELKRAAFGGEAIALWIVPALGLYALGWAIAWVRRGFGTRPK